MNERARLEDRRSNLRLRGVISMKIIKTGAILSAMACLILLASPLLRKDKVDAFVAKDINPETTTEAVRYASQYQWNQTPRSPGALVAGENTVTISPCPRGFMVEPVPGKSDLIAPHEYVYISGTGRPEAAQITRVSGYAGYAACSFAITAKSAHSPGYQVGTATGGIKEASEDAAILADGYGFGFRRRQGGTVILDTNGSPYRIYAPLYIEATNQVIVGAGGTLDCYVSDDSCLRVGDDNANHFYGIQLSHLRFRSAVPQGIHSALYVNANGTHVSDVANLYSSTGGTFGHIVEICDDQAFTLDGLNYGFGLRSDKDFVGSAVYASGPFNKCSAVGWLTHMQISAQCAGNGVDWRSGNSLHVSDSVIQGFAQFGIRTGVMRGGYGPTQLDHLYMEIGSCKNPVGNIGQAGVIAVGSRVTAKTDILFVGQQPRYASSGSKHYIYWVVAKDSKAGYSLPLRVGDAYTNGLQQIRVSWPRIGGNNVSYDLLRTESEEGNAVSAPYGTSKLAISTGIAQCSEIVCSATDRLATPTVYTVSSTPMFSPVLMFWPGGLILSAGATADVILPPVTNMSPVISTGIDEPSLFADHCPGGTPGVYAVCLSGTSFGNNQPRVIGTLLQNGPVSGGGTPDLKGRLNFMQSPAANVTRGHIITLVDSSPVRTLADSLHRPSNGDDDTYIGIDGPLYMSPVNTQLAIGAPKSVSTYIGNKGDGTNWKERLTKTEKTLAVPLVLQPGNTLTVGAGTPISQIRVYATPSLPSITVPSRSCVDQKASVIGLEPIDKITSVTPPQSLGNLSFNAYPESREALVLHFCNPSATSVSSPKGTYSFLAMH